MIRSIALATMPLFLATAQPVFAAPGDEPTMDTASPHHEEIARAVPAMLSGKPDEALKIFDRVIADYERNYDKNTIFRCSPNAMVSYLNEVGASENRKLVLGNEDWCTALWGKGYALIDLQRPMEAEPFLAKAVEMDPVNGHFINEYAEWFKAQRQFKRSKELFTQAWERVDHNKKGRFRTVAARALRGIGFNLIELGDLDGAEKLYRQSLDYEPEAKAIVQQELAYIAQIRDKLKSYK